jgi:hypothetical protein
MAVFRLPPRQVCPLDGRDDDVSIVPGGDGAEWLYVCTAHQEPYNWTVSIPNPLKGRDGVSSELGLYEDLLSCVNVGDPWVEHGVVEYRYWHMRPTTYLRELIPRYGHRADGPRNFSVSVVIAKALGQLRDEGLLAWRYGAATGYWDYNGKISYWATFPSPPESESHSWVEFATSQGLDPKVWDIPRGTSPPR